MKKRVLALCLTVALILGVMSGCGNGAASSSGAASAGEPAADSSEASAADSGGEASEAEAPAGDAGQLPIVTDGSVTLKLFTHTRLGVDDYENNKFTQWLEEQTGVKLDFVVAPEQSALEKLNVLLTSGDYPDVITGNASMPSAQIKLYGGQGIFIPLNDYIEKYGINTKTALEAYPFAKDIITMPDGNIYALPDINDCYHCQMDSKMWIYQPWLDKLNIKTPTTTEEFKAMLKAFKEQDPNGNGKADEIPMMGANNGGWNAFPEFYMMNSFVYYNNQYCGGLFAKDGKVTAAYTEDGWKEGLKYLNGLVSEGLLAPETYTQDNSVLVQNAENKEPILGAVPSGYMGMFCQIDASDRWEDFVAIAPVAGPDGTRYCKWNPYGGATMKYIITSSCKNPEVAFKMGDFLYTPEATMRSGNGPDGEGWRWLEEGTDKLGINGKPATYELLKGVDIQTPNSSWNQATIALRTADFRSSAALADSALFEKPLHLMTETEYAPYQPPIEMVIPPLFFSDEQSNELLTIETTIKTFLQEKTAGFITGALDIDSQWDSYKQELEAIGLPKAIEIYQAALDEANK